MTGAGISTESGLPTYRGKEGLWEGHRLEEIATPQAFARNPEQVLRFYNQRLKQLRQVAPNPAHLALKELERGFVVDIITQNVDDLHERAGSSRVLHLHGRLSQARSSKNPDFVVELGEEGFFELGEMCPHGGQMRPNVVWFGEAVPNMDLAIPLCQQADRFLVVGTSLVVYPAASLVDFVPRRAKKAVIDPVLPRHLNREEWLGLEGKAAEKTPELVRQWLNEAGVEAG